MFLRQENALIDYNPFHFYKKKKKKKGMSAKQIYI
jgi:hypothetical protein